MKERDCAACRICPEFAPVQTLWQDARVAIYRRLPHLWRSPNGYLYIVWSDRGLKRRKSTKTNKLAAAQEALRNFVEQGRSAAAAPSRRTLGEAADSWLQARTAEGVVAPKTLRAYSLTVSRLQAAQVSRIQVGEIEAQDLREIIQSLRTKGVPASALAREVTHLRMLFRWLLRQQAIRHNPADGIETPKAPRGRRPAIRPEQFEALRAAALADLDAAGGESERREAQLLVDIFEVLWRSGLRSIEAIRLRWEDVDLEARTWRIRSPANKGGDQVMPLHPELVPVLRRRKLETAAEAGPFAVEWLVRNTWRRFKTRHKEWAGWSLHSLRHGFVTRVRAAAGDAAAGHLARHKSKAMMEHYSHFDQDTFRSALDGI